VSETTGAAHYGFPPHVLREYAVIADGERGALVGPRGDLAWLCAPRWHDDSVFASLVGGPGVYAVTPVDRFVWGGYYEPRSLIWTSRWVTSAGTVESRDALAMPATAHTAVVLRRVRALDGPARLRVVLDVRAGFGSEGMRVERGGGDGVVGGRSGALRFRWSGVEGASRSGSGPFVLEFTLQPGEHRDLVFELSHANLAGERPDPGALWSATEAHWQQSVPDLTATAVGHRDAELAAAVLRGLTSSAGGMVAAVTMSLPERAETGRNYDYRYAWIRDQCFAGRAAAAHGHLALVESATRFVGARLLSDGPELKPAYTVTGSEVPDERTIEALPGYPGGGNRAGNWVNHQFQLDAFGEALELFAVAAPLDGLDLELWAAVEAAVEAIERRFGEPDAGIWEIHNRRWAHSRLTCVSGLRAIAAHAPPRQAGRWSSLADAVLADVAADCLHPSGRWQRAPDDASVDAALLLPLVRGALLAEDPRTAATLEAVEHELVEEEYVYRFRQDAGPLGESEGAFLLCGFVFALAKLRQGDPLAARAVFERNRSACGTPGLFAEEYDVAQRQLRGNLPQAFVHALFLEASAALGVDTDGLST
jgi:hypothetical protein